jgi:hypothetical protein
MTRRENQTILSTRWNSLDAIESTGPGQANLKASWIAFAFFIPRESTRSETATDSKVLQMRFSRQPSRPIKRRKPKEPKGDFPEAHKEVNYIFGGPDSYEPKRKYKLIAKEIMAIKPATPEYLRWSKVPITFDRGDHPNFIPKPGRYPLVVCPIVKDVKLNRVLVAGGSSLNLLFLKTFNQMGLSRSLLCTSQAPFHGIVPDTTATPVGQISLPVPFGTRENF